MALLPASDTMLVVGSTERRRRQKQELRQQILDAARELFVNEGLEAVTMRKIAEAIEYSATAIYSYFKDKETLIAELCAQDFYSLAQTFGEVARITDPIERLRETGRTYVRFAVQYPNQYRFMFMTRHENEPDEESLARIGNPNEDSYAFVAATVSAAIASGRLRAEYADVDTLTQVFWGAVHGPIALHLAMKHDSPFVDWKPLEQTTDLVIDALIRGCTAPA